MLGDLGKLIVAKGFKKLPKVQKIARSVSQPLHYCLYMSLKIIEELCSLPVARSLSIICTQMLLVELERTRAQRPGINVARLL